MKPFEIMNDDVVVGLEKNLKESLDSEIECEVSAKVRSRILGTFNEYVGDDLFDILVVIERMVEDMVQKR